MYEDYQKSGFRFTLLSLILFSFMLLFFIGSLTSYSDQGYILYHYPFTGKNEVIVCIEGEVHPTHQSYSIIDVEDNLATVNPFVTINGVKQSYLTTLTGKQIDKKIDNLKLGCNTISFGSSRGAFKLLLEYKPHYRPTIDYLEVKNLRAGGKSNRFFISSSEGNQKKTKLTITDVTRSKHYVLFDQTFDGSTADIRIYEPGNLEAQAQVYDGHLWSDIYDTPFSIHIITTSEQKRMMRTYELDDETPTAFKYNLPIAIQPKNDELSKTTKRMLQGGYVFSWRIFNHMQWITHQVIEELKSL